MLGAWLWGGGALWSLKAESQKFPSPSTLWSDSQTRASSCRKPWSVTSSITLASDWPAARTHPEEPTFQRRNSVFMMASRGQGPFSLCVTMGVFFSFQVIHFTRPGSSVDGEQPPPPRPSSTSRDFPVASAPAESSGLGMEKDTESVELSSWSWSWSRSWSRPEDTNHIRDQGGALLGPGPGPGLTRTWLCSHGLDVSQ
ncbi:hypothetical protein EYF80_050238 [Liparis tanakae]|uniref:Uncharacterized protein n=1 Tax=Liparis tanakae TaxID=230148 RepID=A0A4Z2FFP6_9TELE|nr:hypothetical protein EYF80_050238 [Liparis tanakae]